MNGYSYVATCPKCGSMCCAIIDDDPKESAKETGRWIKLGLIISRVTNDEVRAKFSSCRCEAIKLAAQPTLFEVGT